MNIELNTITPINVHNSTSQNTYTVKSINDCNDISEIFQIFDTTNIKEEIENIEVTLLLRIKVDQHFGVLSTNEVQQVAKKCKNKSLVILLTSKNEDKFLIYWKSSEIQHFLKLLPYKNTPMLTGKLFFEYLVEFLANSIANGHLGEF